MLFSLQPPPVCEEKQQESAMEELKGILVNTAYTVISHFVIHLSHRVTEFHSVCLLNSTLVILSRRRWSAAPAEGLRSRGRRRRGRRTANWRSFSDAAATRLEKLAQEVHTAMEEILEKGKVGKHFRRNWVCNIHYALNFPEGTSQRDLYLPS